MKRVLIVAVIALLIPGLLNAMPKVGVYFDYYKMSKSPQVYLPFNAYLYVTDAPYYITGVDYQLLTPGDPSHALLSLTSVTYPDEMSVNLGAPFDGHAISYWPPINGYIEGFHLLCGYEFILLEPCWSDGGGVADYPLVIGPNPATGDLVISYAPDNDLVEVLGLTSIICPEQVATEDASWGAIKSLYK